MSYAALTARLNGATDAGSRVYAIAAPQNAPLPYIVIQRIGGAPQDETFDGPTDIEDGRYQVAYWTTDQTAMAVANRAIRSALSGLSDEPWFLSSQWDDFESPERGEVRTYAVRFEVLMAETEVV